jgi:hypothetical protein
MQALSLLSGSRQLLTLGFVVVLGSCAAPPAREIDLDDAVAIANDTVEGGFGPRGPPRVLIATEKDLSSVRRCFDSNVEPTYRQGVRNKISGRRLYVIRYPLPPVTLEEGDVSIVGSEPCVLIDQDTGEVLGKFPD